MTRKSLASILLILGLFFIGMGWLLMFLMNDGSGLSGIFVLMGGAIGGVLLFIAAVLSVSNRKKSATTIQPNATPSLPATRNELVKLRNSTALKALLFTPLCIASYALPQGITVLFPTMTHDNPILFMAMNLVCFIIFLLLLIGAVSYTIKTVQILFRIRTVS